MATATVAAPAAAQVSWLAERGLVVGARVGSCVKAHAPFGTVTAIRSTDSLTVRWDDARTESVTWTAISPLGYVVEVSATTATAGQWASAATHLENRVEWRTVRIGGVRYVVLTSGNSGRVYHVRADAAGEVRLASVVSAITAFTGRPSVSAIPAVSAPRRRRVR